jgi:hypothetical protein
MSQACEIENLKDISFSERDIKGFNFESGVNSVLNDIGISYLSNPLNNIKEWKSRQGKGSDFKIPSWNWELEAKYSEGKVFPSWIDRDWIPRFKNGTFRVTVHNRGMKLSTNSLERCFIHDVYLVEIGYLKYVLKAEMKHRQEANKLLEAKNSKSELVNNINLENKSSNIGGENIETGNNEVRTEEKTESLTSNDNIDVEREQFLNETLSRYPSLKKNKIRSSKECPNRKYKILVCPLKVFSPRFMCPFRVLYLKRHQKFPSYIEKNGKISLCKNPDCTGEICKTLDLTCSFLVEIDKCPRMYRPKHFCLPLPKPNLADFQPNLTYYLNLSTS